VCAVRNNSGADDAGALGAPGATDVLTAFRGVVALDGPAGTGKSTVARALAARLGLRYLDTGAMYRAATVAVLDTGTDPADAPAVARAVAAARLDIGTGADGARVVLNGRDVTGRIRGPEVTAAVSAVSAVPAVRERMVARQRELIDAGGIVVEGRDIGSTVCPHAELKVFLTASARARASRRAAESAGATGGGPLTEAALAAVERDIRRRDGLDSTRAASPLRKPDDAVELDTSDMSVEQVVARLVAMVGEHDA